MQSVIPIDAEQALSEDLSEYWGHHIFPPPLPESYQQQLPCALVTMVGGTDASMVTYEHDVSIDVYADTFAQAMDNARALAGIFADLKFREPSSGRQWLTSGINALPYVNPDPSNYKVPRVTFTAIASIRGTISNI